MPSAYREIAALQAFDLGFEVLPRFVGRMRGWVWGGYHLDIGTHEALEQARARCQPSVARRSPALIARRDRRRAVFLDRDGTLIEHVHYLSDPAHVRLLPGAAEALHAAPPRRVRPRRSSPTSRRSAGACSPRPGSTRSTPR